MIISCYHYENMKIEKTFYYFINIISSKYLYLHRINHKIPQIPISYLIFASYLIIVSSLGLIYNAFYKSALALYTCSFFKYALARLIKVLTDILSISYLLKLLAFLEPNSTIFDWTLLISLRIRIDVDTILS
jgi:hypothetical protein